jgi:hypothetical protein
MKLGMKLFVVAILGIGIVVMAPLASQAAHELFSVSKAVQTIPPQVSNNATVTTTAVDTNGWHRATFLLEVGSLDNNVAASLSESDSSGSGFVTLSGGTLTTITTAGANKLYGIEVNLNGGRKRYLKPIVTTTSAATGAGISGVMILHQGNASPTTAAEAGLGQKLNL